MAPAKKNDLTTRDRFAMAALCGADVFAHDGLDHGFALTTIDIAERCYAVADAMLAERELQK